MEMNKGGLNIPPKRILYNDGENSLIIRPLEEKDAECLNEAVERSKDILKPFLDWVHQD